MERSGLKRVAYGGPQPLEVDDYEWLVGRDAETAEMVAASSRYHILELTARSGNGKTSFVRAGLAHALAQAGVYVPDYGTWAQARGRLDRIDLPDDLGVQAQIVYRIWIGAEPDDKRPIAEILASRAEGRWTVVILDQLEELIRYRAALAQRVLVLAGDTAVTASVPHVLVARSEYREELSPAEISGAAVWSSRLTEIQDEASLEKILTIPASAVGVEYDTEAARRLIGWWNEAGGAGEAVAAGADPDVGLIHFKALAWAFKAWAVERGCGDARQVTVEMVDGFLGACRVRASERREEHEHGDGAVAIRESLLLYVEATVATLTEPQTVTDDKAGDRELKWRNGPRLMLARVVPALSAAGFKQPQSLYSLVPRAVADELTPRVASRFGQELEQDPQRVRELSERYQPESTAGIAERWPEGGDGSLLPDGRLRLVTQEMIDALRLALTRLTDANILRVFEQDDPIYELVHDSMGTALDVWASDFLQRPEATVGVLAAQAGRIVSISLGSETLDGRGEDDLEIWGGHRERGTGVVAFPALRWPSCLVHGPRTPLAFEGVRFERCDFTSAFFQSCIFRDVVFEACTLRATAMSGCRLEGVRFVGGDLELLTFIEPEPDADVRFDGVATTGLFFKRLPEGCWRFARSRVNHVVIDMTDAARFELQDASVARAVSVTGGNTALVTADATSDVQLVELV